MNDVVREVGGTLGVAVLGSVLASGYGGSMDESVAVDAMATTATLAAAVALLGALIAAAFLPSRAADDAVLTDDVLPEPATA